MHNNDFEILFRSVYNFSKLQLTIIRKNVKKIKCFLYKASWVFELSR